MLAKTGFPEYLESVAIGPSSDFMKKETDLCEVANQFPTEVNLTYLWKGVNTGKDQLKYTRTFTKNLLLDAPEMSEEFLNYYVKKIDLLPPEVKSTIYYEVDNAFTKASNHNAPVVTDTRNFTDVPIHEDTDFVDKLSELLKSCVGSCNYFNSQSDKVASILDFSRHNSIHSSVPHDKDLDCAPPTGMGLSVFNKTPREIQDTISRACTSAKLLMDAAKAQFTDPATAKKLEKMAKQGTSADNEGVHYIGATSPSLIQSIFKIRTRALGKVRTKMGDCFRLTDFLTRFNPFDTSMNLSQASERYFALRLMSANGARTFSINSTGQARFPNTNNVTAAQALATIPDQRQDDSRFSTISGAPAQVAAGDAVPMPILQNTPRSNKSTWHFFTAYSIKSVDKGVDSNSGVRRGNRNNYLEENDMALGVALKRHIEGLLNRILKVGDVLQFTINQGNQTTVKTLRYADTNDNAFGIDQFATNKSSYDSLVREQDSLNRISNTYTVAYVEYKKCLAWNSNLPGTAGV